MSIIYGALERLEATDPRLPGSAGATGLALRDDTVQRLKFTVAALLLALACAALAPALQTGAPVEPPRASFQRAAAAQPTAVGDTSAALPASVKDAASAAVNEAAPQAAAVTPPGAATAAPAAGAVVREEGAAAAPQRGSNTTVIAEVKTDKVADNTRIINDAIGNAQQALSQGNYLGALTALESLPAPLPDRADLWLVKGSAHLALGQLDLADAAFRAAHTLMPNNALVMVQQAVLAQERGEHAAALEILEDAAARHPQVPEIFLNKGFSEQALGNVAQARRSFRTFADMTEHRSLYANQRRTVVQWLAQAG